MNELSSFFTPERENRFLIPLEIILFLATVIFVPMFCIKPIDGNAGTLHLLIYKIIPSLLILHIAASAVWDARTGKVLPYFLTISLSLFFISCIAQAIEIENFSFFFGYLIEDKWIGRLLDLSQVVIGFLATWIICKIINFFEVKLDRRLGGQGDIKCMITFFFFPVDLDIVAKSLMVGLALSSIPCSVMWVRERKGSRIVPWLYLGTMSGLLYFY